jgi:hypothetical protein
MNMRPTDLPRFLALADRTPLAKGSLRNLYQHPGNDDLLIKVMTKRASRRWTTKMGVKVRRRFGIYTDFAREITELLATRSRHAAHPPMLERVVGFVDTDFGLGLIVEKVRGRDGTLARSLHDIVWREGLSDALRERIEELRHGITDAEIITGDMNKKNILHAFDGTRDYLVLVDGIGEKSPFRFNAISRYLNRRTNRRHFRQLVESLERIDRERERAAISAFARG